MTNWLVEVALFLIWTLKLKFPASSASKKRKNQVSSINRTDETGARFEKEIVASMILVNIPTIFLFYLRSTSSTPVVIYIGWIIQDIHTHSFEFVEDWEGRLELSVSAALKALKVEKRRGNWTISRRDACRSRWSVRFSLPQSCVFYASPRNHLVTEKKR